MKQCQLEPSKNRLRSSQNACEFHMPWLITFSTYGSHLPGDTQGSFRHTVHGRSKFIPPNHGLEQAARQHMRFPPYTLDAPARCRVRQAILEVCRHRDWDVAALHVRATHVHVVAQGSGAAQMMRDWKAYATRALRMRESGPQHPYWSRGGNSSVLKNDQAIAAAIHYVLHRQGTPMETWSRPASAGGKRISLIESPA